MVLPARDHDRMGCFTDQVKLIRALVRDLDEAIKGVKLLGEHEEESRQKTTELEALCKKLREDTQRLQEEKVTLEGMVKSCDELLLEITREIGLDCMGEDAEDEEEDEDANDGEEATTPPCCHTTTSCAPADVSYAAPQAHGFVNVALHREYSLGIVFIFNQGRKDLYHL
jgi:hypothetical protein